MGITVERHVDLLNSGKGRYLGGNLTESLKHDTFHIYCYPVLQLPKGIGEDMMYFQASKTSK